MADYKDQDLFPENDPMNDDNQDQQQPIINIPDMNAASNSMKEAANTQKEAARMQKEAVGSFREAASRLADSQNKHIHERQERDFKLNAAVVAQLKSIAAAYAAQSGFDIDINDEQFEKGIEDLLNSKYRELIPIVRELLEKGELSPKSAKQYVDKLRESNGNADIPTKDEQIKQEMEQLSKFDKHMFISQLTPTAMLAQGSMFALSFPIQMALFEPIVQPFTMIKGAFDQIKSGISGFTGLDYSIQTLQKIMTQPPLGRYEDIYQTKILLSSSLGGDIAANKAIDTAIQMAKEYPLQAAEILQSIRSLSVYPEVKPYMSDEKFQKELIETVSGLALINPEQGLKGALFSIVEAMSGSFRSLQMRFNVSPEIIARESGISLAEMKSDPYRLITGLHRFVANTVGLDVLEAQKYTFTKQVENLDDALTLLTKNIFETSGVYSTISKGATVFQEAFSSATSTPAFYKFIEETFLNKYNDQMAQAFGKFLGIKPETFKELSPADLATIASENFKNLPKDEIVKRFRGLIKDLASIYTEVQEDIDSALNQTFGMTLSDVGGKIAGMISKEIANIIKGVFTSIISGITNLDFLSGLLNTTITMGLLPALGYKAVKFLKGFDYNKEMKMMAEDNLYGELMNDMEKMVEQYSGMEKNKEKSSTESKKTIEDLLEEEKNQIIPIGSGYRKQVMATSTDSLEKRTLESSKISNIAAEICRCIGSLAGKGGVVASNLTQERKSGIIATTSAGENLSPSKWKTTESGIIVPVNLDENSLKEKLKNSTKIPIRIPVKASISEGKKSLEDIIDMPSIIEKAGKAVQESNMSTTYIKNITAFKDVEPIAVGGFYPRKALFIPNPGKISESYYKRPIIDRYLEKIRKNLDLNKLGGLSENFDRFSSALVTAFGVDIVTDMIPGVSNIKNKAEQDTGIDLLTATTLGLFGYSTLKDLGVFDKLGKNVQKIDKSSGGLLTKVGRYIKSPIGLATLAASGYTAYQLNDLYNQSEDYKYYEDILKANNISVNREPDKFKLFSGLAIAAGSLLTRNPQAILLGGTLGLGLIADAFKPSEKDISSVKEKYSLLKLSAAKEQEILKQAQEIRYGNLDAYSAKPYIENLKGKILEGADIQYKLGGDEAALRFIYKQKYTSLNALNNIYGPYSEKVKDSITNELIGQFNTYKKAQDILSKFSELSPEDRIGLLPDIYGSINELISGENKLSSPELLYKLKQKAEPIINETIKLLKPEDVETATQLTQQAKQFELIAALEKDKNRANLYSGLAQDIYTGLQTRGFNPTELINQQGGLVVQGTPAVAQAASYKLAEVNRMINVAQQTGDISGLENLNRAKEILEEIKQKGEEGAKIRIDVEGLDKLKRADEYIKSKVAKPTDLQNVLGDVATKYQRATEFAEYGLNEFAVKEIDSALKNIDEAIAKGEATLPTLSPKEQREQILRLTQLSMQRQELQNYKENLENLPETQAKIPMKEARGVARVISSLPGGQYQLQKQISDNEDLQKTENPAESYTNLLKLGMPGALAATKILQDYDISLSELYNSVDSNYKEKLNAPKKVLTETANIQAKYESDINLAKNETGETISVIKKEEPKTYYSGKVLEISQKIESIKAQEEQSNLMGNILKGGLAISTTLAATPLIKKGQGLVKGLFTSIGGGTTASSAVETLAASEGGSLLKNVLTTGLEIGKNVFRFGRMFSIPGLLLSGAMLGGEYLFNKLTSGEESVSTEVKPEDTLEIKQKNIDNNFIPTETKQYTPATTETGSPKTFSSGTCNLPDLSCLSGLCDVISKLSCEGNNVSSTEQQINTEKISRTIAEETAKVGIKSIQTQANLESARTLSENVKKVVLENRGTLPEELTNYMNQIKTTEAYPTTQEPLSSELPTSKIEAPEIKTAETEQSTHHQIQELQQTIQIPQQQELSESTQQLAQHIQEQPIKLIQSPQTQEQLASIIQTPQISEIQEPIIPIHEHSMPKSVNIDLGELFTTGIQHQPQQQITPIQHNDLFTGIENLAVLQNVPQQNIESNAILVQQEVNIEPEKEKVERESDIKTVVADAIYINNAYTSEGGFNVI